ncbi:MAG: SBBP repeat-containing protein, partial [Candidatus Sulfotelmatobacter sp.]
MTKFAANGSSLVYSTYVGGTDNDSGNAIALDASGDAYIAGGTSSSDFPTTTGAFQTTYGGGNLDAFVFELNSNGTALVYSTYLGGSNDDVAVGIALDSSY